MSSKRETEKTMWDLYKEVNAHYKNLRAILKTSGDIIYFKDFFEEVPLGGFFANSVHGLLKEAGYDVSELEEKLKTLEYLENKITEARKLYFFEEEKSKVEELIEEMSFFRKQKNKE